MKKACLPILFSMAVALPGTAQVADTPLPAAMQDVMQRPAFRHSSFGLAVYSLDQQRMIWAHNAEQFFTPASTTKLLTEGTTLALLGADFRFHTRMVRTGPVDRHGTLHGDLVLQASGDPDLSGRQQADGRLAFENEDHAYGGSPDTRAVPGDPLQALRDLAHQVAARGIRRVTGRILVDVSLFPEGEAELGTGTVESPVCVNDNIVDVTALPASHLGQPLGLQVSPASPYVRFVNHTTTVASGGKAEIDWTADVVNPDLTHTVTVTGSLPLGGPSRLFAYAAPSPSQFAAVAMTQALQDGGVAVEHPATLPAATKAGAYVPLDLVAEHVSAPLSEDIRITLKVSQNLHASMMPLLLGALRGHVTAGATAPSDWAQAGFDQEHQFLQQAGLDLDSASQADGAGGAQSAFFTPSFMAHYLAYFAGRQDFPVLFAGLPVLGRDGTLFNIQTQSPAAGQVHAKTGTFSGYNALNRTVMVTGKGLAGYFTEPDGRRYAFAFYINRVPVSLQEDAVTAVVGQAIGELAADAYTALLRPIS